MTIKTFKGEMMKRHYLRMAMALVSFAGFGVAAKGQVPDQILVKIPFEFVVAGKTLPAGTYRVNRLSDDKWEGLVLSSQELHASVVLHPIEVESAQGENPRATFQKAGDEHFLSKIETDENVFTIPVSQTAVLEALAKSHTGTPAGSASGTD
jgi:hypothetical protein